MYILKTIKDYKSFYKNEIFDKKIGFVPTMGALHAGHFSLLEKARRKNDIVVLSIFVNPIQFGANEDLGKYPRTFDADVALAEKAGVDVIFYPNVEEMYFEEQTVFVEVEGISNGLCGAKRAGHFRGVATVVAKLFNIIHPANAYFGQKDYQQFLVIDKMVRQLNFDVNLVMCPIVREEDGLAMSSRNKYLNAEERQAAICLNRALKIAENLIRNEKVTDVEYLRREIVGIIEQNESAKIDYIFIGNSATLEELKNLEDLSKNVVIALAVYIGKTRLIDNVLIVK
jgi:pantoate--beta-alanine ligase